MALVGWSSRALVALLHWAHDPRVTDRVGIAPLTRPLPSQWGAEHDHFFPAEEVPPLAPRHVAVVPGADDFSWHRDEEAAGASWLSGGRP